MWDLYVFDNFEAATRSSWSTRIQNVCSNLCPRSSDLIITEIPMIFCRHIPWVALVCSAKYQPNCSRLKHHIFALFSKSISVMRMKLGRDIAWGNGHLVREDGLKWPWIWLPFNGQNLHFCTFSRIISPKMAIFFCQSALIHFVNSECLVTEAQSAT